jgi:hypothetical protein
VSPAGGTPLAAWDLILVDGGPACPPVRRSTFGTTDIRVLIELYGLEVALGAISPTMSSALEAEVGPTFATEWAPYVGSLTVDAGGDLYEASYVFGYAGVCGDLTLDGAGAPTPLPAPVSSIVDGVWTASPHSLIPLEATVGLDACVQPAADIDEDWSPIGTMSPSYVLVSGEGFSRPRGLVDYWVDPDGDGAPEERSARITFDLYDAADVHLCTVDYDASASVSVLGSVTAANGSPLYGAWTVPLADGDSDCPSLDPRVWGTNDIRVVLEYNTLGFAVGDIVDLGPYLPDLVGADYPEYEPYLMGGYSIILGVAYETGYALGYTATGCFEGDLDAPILPPAVGSPEGLYLTVAAFGFPFGV